MATTIAGWKAAFSLSSTEVKNAVPPGTVTLVERRHEAEDGAGFKDGGRIIKVPTPSSDPADPLNWPVWRKAAVLLMAAMYPFVADFVSSVIAPAFPVWNSAFPQEPKPVSDLTHLIAVNVLMLGMSNIWWVPLSNWMGRRPVLLVGTLLMTLCSMWAGLATSYNSLLAARIIQGIGAGPSEAVAPCLVGDVFFVHQRGRAMAVYTIAICTGPLVGGIAGGYIGTNLGWAYLFWISTALSGFCFIGFALLVPETLYFRSIDAAVSAGLFADTVKEVNDTHAENVVSSPAEQYRPFTFIRSLSFAQPQSFSCLLHSFLRPWVTCALPGNWVVMLMYGALVGGIVTISVIGAQIMAAPPYSWGANAGLINVGGLIGAGLGAIFTYFVSDAQLEKQAKKESHGHAEPEARLSMLFPSLFLSTGGFFVFGFCAQNPGSGRWVGLQVGYGMITFGLMQIPSLGFTYLIDAYKNLAADCFVATNVSRSVIAFAWTFFVGEWIAKAGAAEAFGIFGMLMGIFSVLTVPLWLFGKRMRIATAPLVERYNRPEEEKF
ncbi:Major facilitator superfamily domain, general substrate transporter [Penicillium occitanis (nom. inval.)]|nr:hypothetical protein PENOC_107600 [Penicillium occitanis (nom. inval.)]PCG89213.1 Major facilitator superfamily domain, general substrate transporter [Penicillium occitanis (nom. inval.)]